MGVKTLYVCIDIIIKVGGRIFGFRRGDRNEMCLSVGLFGNTGDDIASPYYAICEMVPCEKESRML